MIRAGGILTALGLASGVFAISAPAQACELVVYTYPRPPLNLEDFPPSHYTVISGEIVEARLVRTFEPWDQPGGQVWDVTMSLRDIRGLPQPANFGWVINPCGRPLPDPKVGEQFDLLVSREGTGWSVSDVITSSDLRRFVARNAPRD